MGNKVSLLQSVLLILFRSYLSYSGRRQWQPTPVLLSGKSHGLRSLVGCSPWGCQESDMTERLHFHFYALEKEMATHSCSCLENSRDRGSLVGCHLWGHTESDTTEAIQQQQQQQATLTHIDSNMYHKGSSMIQ